MPEQQPKRATSEVVAEARKLAKEGWTQGRIARHLGFNVGTVGRWLRGETHQAAKTEPKKLDLEAEVEANARESEERFRRLMEEEAKKNG